MKIVNQNMQSVILHSDWWALNRTIDLAFWMNSGAKSRLVTTILPAASHIFSTFASDKPFMFDKACKEYILAVKDCSSANQESRNFLCPFVDRQQPDLEWLRRSAFLVFIIKPLQVKMPASCNFLRSPALIPCAITEERLSVPADGDFSFY